MCNLINVGSLIFPLFLLPKRKFVRKYQCNKSDKGYRISFKCHNTRLNCQNIRWIQNGDDLSETSLFSASLYNFAGSWLFAVKRWCLLNSLRHWQFSIRTAFVRFIPISLWLSRIHWLIISNALELIFDSLRILAHKKPKYFQAIDENDLVFIFNEK